MKGKFLIIFVICLSMYNFQKLEFLSEEEKKDALISKKSSADLLKWILRFSKLPALEDKSHQEPLSKEVIDFVMGLERKDLINTAYTLERYHRRVTGQKDLIGGLHDYVFKITEDQIRNYVFKQLTDHPELGEMAKLDKLLKESNRSTEELSGRDFIVGGSVHEYLNKLDKEKMKKLAIKLEEYHRKQKDEFVFGGLHDYINTISEEELRSYISKEVNEHQEINTVSALDDFIKK